MNQPTTLDLTGGWESIVNNVDRHNARLRFEAYLYQRKLHKKISKIINFALGAIICVTLGLTGLLAPWLAGGTAILLVCAACFLGGRLCEGLRGKKVIDVRK